jgi:hypothetical protein
MQENNKNTYFMSQFLQHISFVEKVTQFMHILLRKNHIFIVTYLISCHLQKQPNLKKVKRTTRNTAHIPLVAI